jgi:uncharacterized membrane-anchored protein YhcB (DUF1043 family)
MIRPKKMWQPMKLQKCCKKTVNIWLVVALGIALLIIIIFVIRKINTTKIRKINTTKPNIQILKEYELDELLKQNSTELDKQFKQNLKKLREQYKQEPQFREESKE